MKRTLSLSDLADRVITNRPASPLSEESRFANTENPVGLVHLLEHHTLDQIVDSDRYPELVEKMREFMCEGRLPDDRTQRNQIAEMMQDADEPRVFHAMLKLGNMSVSIKNAADIKLLLDAVDFEPAAIFSNIGLLIIVRRLEVAQAMLPSLITLLRANKFDAGIELAGDLPKLSELPDLFDALSEIRNLKLSIGSTGRYVNMETDTVVKLVELLRRNETVQMLELINMAPIDSSSASPRIFIDLLHELKEQKFLKVLRIGVATAECKKLIGDLVENSHSIQRLSIDLHGAASAPSLIRGLKKNTSLKMLSLTVDSIAQSGRASSYGALPLISLLEKNKCTATEFVLDISRCGADEITSLFKAENDFNENRSVIETLIASNTTLNSLTIVVSSAVPVDLLPIGKGLKKNQSLERLHIGSRHSPDLGTEMNGLIDRSTLPAFLKEIAKNETLIQLTFEYIGWGELDDFQDDELTRILSRNDNFGKYACSFGYVHGAVAGFLNMMNMPYDVATPIVEYLAGQSPPAASRALAFVNKAANSAARAGRRNEAGNILNQVLYKPQTDRKKAIRDMVNLFARMTTKPQDFADDDVKKIGHSELLMPGLNCFVQKYPWLFIALARRLDEVAGIKISRRQIISSFLTEHLGDSADDEAKLDMLAGTFTPDQQHLAYLMDHEVNDTRPLENELKLFVGYDMLSSEPDTDAVFDLCVFENEPELYLAYMENYPDKWLSTDEMYPAFRNRFLSRMPLSQRVRRLCIIDFDDKTDAEAVASILSNSPLQHLNLMNTLCSEVTFKLLMRKLAANTELKNMEISFYEKAETFPVIENIKSALHANATLELLVLNVPPDHAEHALLAQLALSEPRFEVDTSHPAEAGDRRQ